MLSILRWLILVPIVVFAWYNFLSFGLSAYSKVEAKYCGSSVCSFFADFVLHVIYFGIPALSALVVGIVAVVIAPSHKLYVAWSTFVIGTIAVLAFIGLGVAPLISGVITLMTGLIGAIFISYIIKRFHSRLENL